MLKYTWGLLSVVLLGLTGCVSQSNFRGPAYMHEQHAYLVSYDDAAKQQIMGDEWILDNYRRGEATASGESETLSRKEAPEYMAVYSFDLDDDGKYEDKEKLPAYDLLFKNRKTNAQIWVSTIPLSRETAEKELRVLLDNYIDAMSGSGAVVSNLGKGLNVNEKRFSARLIDKTPVKLSGKDALAATIEVANIDQLKLSPDARREKARIVLVRPDFRVLRERSMQDPVPFRVLMIVGYSNGPEDFDAQYAEFKRFLGKIHLMTDEQVLEIMQSDLQQCVHDQKAPSTLQLLVRKNGSVKIEEVSNLIHQCTMEVLATVNFPNPGEEHSVKHAYDWSKPAKLKWLSQQGYEEPEAPRPSSPSTAEDESMKPEVEETAAPSDETEKGDPRPD